MNVSTKYYYTQGSEIIVEWGQNDCKDWRIREFAVRPCPLETLIKSHQHDGPNSEHAKVDSKSPTLHKELDITEKNREQERRSFSRTVHTNLLSSAQWSSPENIHTIIRWTEQVTLRNTHVCTYVYIHAVTIREKGGYRFEEE